MPQINLFSLRLIFAYWATPQHSVRRSCWNRLLFHSNFSLLFRKKMKRPRKLCRCRSWQSLFC